MPSLFSTWMVMGSGVPVKSLLGTNVTSPVSGSSVYVPTSLPSHIAGIVVSSTGCPFTTIFAGFSAEGLSSVPSPSLNVGVPVWVAPCSPLDVLSSPVGSAFTVGVYIAVAVVPFSFVASTVTPPAFPVNPSSGTKVTSPVLGSIVYVPSPGTFTASVVGLPVSGSIKL